jgi:hypothetical protein
VLIGLDYDKTYTADPLFWRQVVALARQRGHEVVCVTARREPPGSHEPRLPEMAVVCAGSEFKRHAAAKAGHHVDVWIDDMPGLIEPCRVLQW